MTELRTNADIVRDLLKFLIDHQWLSGDVYLGHGDYATGCEDCGANFNERDTHNPRCPRAALILEAQAFLTAEAAAEKTFEVERDESTRLECLYKKVMSDDEDYSRLPDPFMAASMSNTFTVRLWDGMDGAWCDCGDATNVSKKEALRLWAEKTENGTKNIKYDEIDYYRIFPADTNMLWSGDHEMHRGAKS